MYTKCILRNYVYYNIESVYVYTCVCLCVCVYLLLHKRVAYEEWYVFMSGLLLSESPGYFLLPAGSWRRYITYLDQQLSALVCKTLWNYSDKMTSLSCFGAEETELLIEQLEVYLGVCACACVCVCVCVCVRVHCRYTLLCLCSSSLVDEELAAESVLEGVPEETRPSSMTCGGVSSVQWLSHSWSM